MSIATRWIVGGSTPTACGPWRVTRVWKRSKPGRNGKIDRSTTTRVTSGMTPSWWHAKGPRSFRRVGDASWRDGLFVRHDGFDQALGSLLHRQWLSHRDDNIVSLYPSP